MHSADETKMVMHMRGLGRLDKLIRNHQKRHALHRWRFMADYLWWLKQDQAARMLQRIWRGKTGRNEFLHNMAAVAYKKLMQMRAINRLLGHERHVYRSFFATTSMQEHVRAAYRAARKMQSQFRRMQAMKVSLSLFLSVFLSFSLSLFLSLSFSFSLSFCLCVCLYVCVCVCVCVILRVRVRARVYVCVREREILCDFV